MRKLMIQWLFQNLHLVDFSLVLKTPKLKKLKLKKQKLTKLRQMIKQQLGRPKNQHKKKKNQLKNKKTQKFFRLNYKRNVKSEQKKLRKTKKSQPKLPKMAKQPSKTYHLESKKELKNVIERRNQRDQVKNKVKSNNSTSKK